MGKTFKRYRLYYCEVLKKPRENSLAEFDCGAAWMALTIQARLLGYYTHGMGGMSTKIEELLI